MEFHEKITTQSFFFNWLKGQSLHLKTGRGDTGNTYAVYGSDDLDLLEKATREGKLIKGVTQIKGRVEMEIGGTSHRSISHIEII